MTGLRGHCKGPRRASSSVTRNGNAEGRGEGVNRERKLSLVLMQSSEEKGHLA